MYTITDIPAFREQILANVNFFWAGKGTSCRFDVVLSAIDEGTSYVASVVDVNANELWLTADPDNNPAMAVFKLLDRTAEKMSSHLKGMQAKEPTLADKVVHGTDAQKA